MRKTTSALALACGAALALSGCGQNAQSPVERGKYLVTITVCGDCHTPGALMGKPDMNRYIGGSEVSFFLPGLGYFHPPNLTPDNKTGLGKWSEDEIVTALRTGKRPDGRILAPIMPWQSLASLTDSDAHAIAAYLKSLPPIANKVPALLGAGETPAAPYMTVVMPSAPSPAPTINDAPPVTPETTTTPPPTPQ